MNLENILYAFIYVLQLWKWAYGHIKNGEIGYIKVVKVK